MFNKIMKISKILKDSNIGDTVTVSGWVLTCRKQKNMSFSKCTDGSSTEGIQLIWEGADEDVSSKIHTGCSIKANGKLVESPMSGQKYELQLISYELIGDVYENYPLTKNKMNLETLRNFYHLRGRTNSFGSIYRIRSKLIKFIHDFFQDKDFLNLSVFAFFLVFNPFADCPVGETGCLPPAVLPSPPPCG